MMRLIRTHVLIVALAGLALGAGLILALAHRLPAAAGAGVAQTAPAPAPAPASAGEPKVLYWYDPMHPWYKSDKPGVAPDCGMKLVPMYAEEGTGGLHLPAGTVQISAARQQLIGVITAPAEYRSVDKTLRTVGSVALDETRIATVHVRVNGWIQKVFVDFRFDHVRKGEPLFTLYSPDLVATEQEYLLALKAERELGGSPYPDVARSSKSLFQAARERLKLWNVTDDQVRKLEQTGQPEREITYYSPAMGHVLERNVFPNQYVTPETELYKIVDHNVVWVFADIYQNEIPDVSLGQEAVITSDALPNISIRGRVDYLQPHIMDDTRTLPVRIEVPNPELKLNPGMFVNVTLHRALGRHLVVPIDAVLDSGQRQIVFVDRGQGYFEPRPVEVLDRTQDFAVIGQGLSAGERVVLRANFLIDSESNLREALAGMAGMPGMEMPSGGAGQGATPPSPTPEGMPGMPGMKGSGGAAGQGAAKPAPTTGPAGHEQPQH